MHGSDLFLGLSQPDLVSAEMLKSMAARPIILALSNPDPEVSPDLVQEYRPDAIMATGRSDFPNQVNNVLCFPFLFRGALDVGATEINVPMKIACVRALAKLAQAEVHGTAKNRKTGQRCLNPAAFGCKTCRYHGARKILSGLDHPNYKHGGRTLEALSKYSQKVAELDQLEQLGHKYGLIKGSRRRGRKVAQSMPKPVALWLD